MAFISEIHYRNTVAGSTGTSEFVELSLSPDDMARIGDFSFATYQSDGTLRSSFDLVDLTGTVDPATGWTLFQITTPLTDPDHTVGSNEAEALALVDGGRVVTFYDIGGGTSGITALDGPAAGSISQNIAAATGPSIQFDAVGNRMDGPLSEGSSVICLTDGTLIDTPDGDRMIEDLAIGDLVTTLDGGAQPIRMIHTRTLEGAALRRDRRLWPVCIQAGALGFGLPRRSLRVSPQHRMLYRHIRIPLMFGEDAVFVRAKSLAANFEEIFVDSTVQSLTYYHLVFDRHEVIFAEGSATESFYPGPEGVAALHPEARGEFFALFPEMRVNACPVKPDYMTLRSWELMAMVG